MGAANAIAAYQLYAGRVPPISMQVLGYMALVSRDSDEYPWFSLGHEALAVHALGRQAPTARADVKAVERAITPLLAIGAIVTDRRAAVRRDGRSTARYRLQLVHGEHADIDEPLVDNSAVSHSRPPESGLHVPRNPSPRPPESVPTSPEFRGTEEKEEKEELVKENHQTPEGTARPSTTSQQDHEEHRSDQGGAPPTCPSCGTFLDPDQTCRNRTCRARDPTLAQIIPLRPTRTETR